MLGTGDHAVCGNAGPFAPFLKEPARFDLLSRRVPALNGAGAAAEREALAEIARLLGGLNAYVGDFRAGLKLLDYADAHAEFAWSWGPIACRDAGAALTNFRAALKQMAEALKRCPSRAGAKRAIRPVEQRFSAAFPSARARRNGSAAGAGGNPASPPTRRHDDMCDARILAGVSREGRRVRHASNGRQMSFELSEHALWMLVAFRNEAFAAFEEAAAED